MSKSHTAVPMIDQFSTISSRYDALVCDVWGVLHNGVRVTRAANEALAAARRRGLAVVMLTNAPRPSRDIHDFILSLGGTPDGWDAIVSSGGVTRDLMAKQGKRAFYHLGPKRDETVFRGLEAVPVALEKADYVLCTGLFRDETETAESYRGQLELMLGRGLEMICANPDLVVERGPLMIPCAGAVADLYETLGGKVTWVGKPHPLVYDYAKVAIEQVLGRSVEKSRILGIGDAIRTDITGATAFGIDSLFVMDGIHAEELGLRGSEVNSGTALAFHARQAVRPTWATHSLKD